MQLTIEKTDPVIWNAQLSRFHDQNFMHLWEYGETKSELEAWSVERGLFMEGDEILGMAQILLRKIPFLGRGMVWINRGPLSLLDDQPDPSNFKRMLKLLVSRYVDDQRHYLRIGPSLTTGTIPEEIIDGATIRVTSTPGWASAKVDLARPLPELRKALDGKWRNCLKKGERSGYTVKSATDGEVFEDFLNAQENFCRDRRLHTNFNRNFISRLQNQLASNKKMTALVAYKDGSAIGSALFATYGNTGEYLAGNSTELGRRLNSGQVLLWNGLEVLKAKGMRWLDLGGMDAEVTPKGIFHFKSGLKGEVYRLHNEVESLDPWLIAQLARFRIYLRSCRQTDSVPQ